MIDVVAFLLIFAAFFTVLVATLGTVISRASSAQLVLQLYIIILLAFVVVKL